MLAAEHEAVVLAAVLPSDRGRLAKLLTGLTETQFTDADNGRLYRFLALYSAKTGGGVLRRKVITDLVNKQTDGIAQVLALGELYDKYAAVSVGDDEFLWSVEQIRELARKRSTEELLKGALERLNGRSGEEEEHGAAGAGAYLLEGLAAISQDFHAAEAPEGTIQDEKAEILAEFRADVAARAAGAAPVVHFGIPGLDEKVGGLQRGALAFAAGYSSSGKTTLCVQAAWSAAVEQGKNVVFFTTETLRAQVRNKLISRHSRLDRFGLADGLNYLDIKKRNEAILPTLERVLDDLTENPDYGRIRIVQVPKGASIASLDQRLHHIQRTEFEVDLVVMDYLKLLAAERNWKSSREEYAGIVVGAKQLAVTFNDGRGVAFLSPWQINREGHKESKATNGYTTAALAETAEATNSADVIVSLRAPDDHSERWVDLSMQVLKNRDGETANDIPVRCDYATSYFTAYGASFGASPTPGSPSDDLDSLLS